MNAQRIQFDAFTIHSPDRSVSFKRQPLRWALDRRSETLPMGILDQRTQTAATLAVVLGIDDQCDLVLIDEGDELNPVPAIEQAIEVLQAMRDRLQSMTSDT